MAEPDFRMGDMAALDAYGSDRPPDEDPFARAARRVRAPYAAAAEPADKGLGRVARAGAHAIGNIVTIPYRMGTVANLPEEQMTATEDGPRNQEEYERARAQAVGETTGETIRLGVPMRNPLGAVPSPSAAVSVLTAGGRRPRRPIYTTEAPEVVVALPPRTHNLPNDVAPLPAAGTPTPPPKMGAVADPTTYAGWLSGLPRAAPAGQSTDLPNLRDMPLDQAIEIARRQPHLIPSGERGEGKYVGGPRDVQSKATLNKIRRDFDEFVGKDPRGYDWYDRYRTGQASTTGNDPVQNEWQAKQHGQFSAGVDPGSELHFVLKENNASIAGMPVKAARPAQHEAHERALAMKDPNQYQLGEKTGEYADKVNPDQPLPFVTGTGVNDFRHARNFKYTEKGGEPQKGALGDAGHRFLDYETTLAVDRANQAALGGRTDWTGERLQAAPWVRQKAEDLMSRNPNLSYEEAMQRALRTVVDYYPRHTYNATFEAQPGAAVVNHMAESVNAPQAVRDRYALDPASTWATAPGGRDAIYSGLGIEGTGNYMRVLPSQPMRGLYTNQAGKTESNLGEVAQPLGTFDVPTRKYDKEFVGPREYEPFKQATKHDTAIMNAGEAVRGLIDAQEASAWHKLWGGGPNKQMGALAFPRSGPATESELLAMQSVGEKHGLPFVSDTGKGVTMFGGPEVPTKAFEQELKRAGGDFAQFGKHERARADSGYIPRDWSKEGSGTATRQMLEYVNATPELRAAFNNNQYIAERSAARLERDDKWAAQWGAPRADIQRLRAIIAESPTGWVDRVEAALKRGELLPATVGALFSGALGLRQLERERRSSDAPL
jgi:hypothetical protein